jgi:hypothetical protein
MHLEETKSDLGSDDVRLAEILDRYLIDQQHGTAVGQDELVAQHPDLEKPLRECLASMALLDQGVAELHDVTMAP